MDSLLEYDITEKYDSGPESVSSYFEENDVIYITLGSRFENNIPMLIYSACITDEDALFLRLKFPDIVVRKISTI